MITLSRVSLLSMGFTISLALGGCASPSDPTEANEEEPTTDEVSSAIPIGVGFGAPLAMPAFGAFGAVPIAAPIVAPIGAVGFGVPVGGFVAPGFVGGVGFGGTAVGFGTTAAFGTAGFGTAGFGTLGFGGLGCAGVCF